MKLYLQRKRSCIDAVAEYDTDANTFTVLKGSRISADVAHTGTFRGTKSIEKSRIGTVVNCVTTTDIAFKSSSTAANFVTGTSTNGLIAWKSADGRTLKEIMKCEEA